MKFQLFTLAVLCLLASAAAGSDHCTPNPDCKTCLAHSLCGWCSTNVVYKDGTPGSQCAGFNSDPKVKNEWNCSGTYTIDKCDEGKYACVDQKCIPTKFGVDKATCEKTCKKTPPSPPAKQKFYTCHVANKTCVEVPKGTGNATDYAACEAECNPKYLCNHDTNKCEKDSSGIPQEECEQVCKVNPVPSQLQGHWRGLQISKKYEAGEWKFDLSADSYSLTSPSGVHSSGVASLSSGLLSLTTSGGIQLGMYEVDLAVETKMLTVGLGLPGAPAPVSFDAAMTADEFVFMSCLDPTDKTKCNFSKALNKIAILGGRKELGRPKYRQLIDLPPLRSNEMAPGGDFDQCAHFADCESCVTSPDQQCGWCSTPVKYSDGTEGARCAGWNDPKHPTPKFTCDGLYSTDQCVVGYVCNTTSHTCHIGQPGEGLPKEKCESECVKPAQTYVCDKATNTCKKAAPGKGESKLLCEASCQHPKPSNSTPAHLIGEWRGLEVNLGYKEGEFDLTFGNGTFKMTQPGGGVLSGDVTSTKGLDKIDLIVRKGPSGLVGKTLHGMFNTMPGPETTFETFAFSGPAASKEPSSFDSAMTGKDGDSEYVFLKCGGRAHATKNCVWNVPKV
mmetsp:Transcript_18761/g.22476  ORF Transcript_18761/g.22476 Transcript_18761/m.22476 type:complete len:616 (+) Transcript_18761:100-1947(+)